MLGCWHTEIELFLLVIPILLLPVITVAIDRVDVILQLVAETEDCNEK